jgi:hypothetical protein
MKPVRRVARGGMRSGGDLLVPRFKQTHDRKKRRSCDCCNPCHREIARTTQRNAICRTRTRARTSLTAAMFCLRTSMFVWYSRTARRERGCTAAGVPAVAAGPEMTGRSAASTCAAARLILRSRSTRPPARAPLWASGYGLHAKYSLPLLSGPTSTSCDAGAATVSPSACSDGG